MRDTSAVCAGAVAALAAGATATAAARGEALDAMATVAEVSSEDIACKDKKVWWIRI